MDPQEQHPYLIPRAIRTRFHFFPAFGVFEFLALIAGLAVGGILQFIVQHLTFIPLSVAARLGVRFFFFALPPGSVYLLVKPSMGGASMLQQLKDWREWSHRPKLYLFRKGAGGR